MVSNGSFGRRSFLDSARPSRRYLHLERHRAGETAVDVADWLRELGLERYEAAFRENGVSAEVLCHLTAEDLKELGVTAVGHRRQLLVAIAKLNEQRTTDTVAGGRTGDGFGAAPRSGGFGWRTPPAHGDVLRPGGFDGTE